MSPKETNKKWFEKCTCENFQQNEDCEHIGDKVLKEVGLAPTTREEIELNFIRDKINGIEAYDYSKFTDSIIEMIKSMLAIARLEERKEIVEMLGLINTVTGNGSEYNRGVFDGLNKAVETAITNIKNKK